MSSKKESLDGFRRVVAKLPPWILTSLTVALILWLTLAPKPLGDEEIPLFPGADKLAHAIMFGFLTTMELLDFQRRRKFRPTAAATAAIAAILSAAFGVAVEYMQRAMQLGRGFETEDMVADAIGAVLAAVCWTALQRHWTKP